jgi:hypothetical protein
MFFLVAFILISQNGVAGLSGQVSDQVAMRMIGHRVLLMLGDSTSQVLPVEITGPNEYKISFESDIQFEPSEMVETINEVVIETRVAERYAVEMISCDSKDSLIVVYSYLVDSIDQSDIIPCRGREVERKCYSILFTILEGTDDGMLVKASSDQAAGGGDEKSINLSYILLVMMVLVGLAVIWKLRSNSLSAAKVPHHDETAIGQYIVDYRNMHLLFDEERIELSSKEADLLKLLHDSANETLDRDHILKEVWGDDGDYVGRTLDVFVSKLRRKLEKDQSVRIVNVRGVGYKLIVN